MKEDHQAGWYGDNMVFVLASVLEKVPKVHRVQTSVLWVCLAILKVKDDKRSNIAKKTEKVVDPAKLWAQPHTLIKLFAFTLPENVFWAKYHISYRWRQHQLRKMKKCLKHPFDINGKKDQRCKQKLWENVETKPNAESDQS